MINISAVAARTHTAVFNELAAHDLVRRVATNDTNGQATIRTADEQASCNDVVLERVSAPPHLVRGNDAMPHVIQYRDDDAVMAAMLAVEMVRERHCPAAADPLSFALFNHAEQLARSDIAVLIEGETGTGKEGIARLIHCRSSRSANAFTAVNCAALPPTMIEAMLFGHVRGSFTGAATDHPGLFAGSHGGTIFLDEIGEMPLDMQAKLLRVLQDGEVLPIGAIAPRRIDVRIIAATNRNLANEVLAGRFRSDLYWRLNVVPLAMLPLRQRPMDIGAIAAHFLVRHTPDECAVRFINAHSLDALRAHNWPGNARELENVIQRALVLDDSPILTIAVNPPRGETQLGETRPGETRRAGQRSERDASLADHVRAAEARAIRDVLLAVAGHRRAAAERLGVSERTLRNRIAVMRSRSTLTQDNAENLEAMP